MTQSQLSLPSSQNCLGRVLTNPYQILAIIYADGQSNADNSRKQASLGTCSEYGCQPQLSPVTLMKCTPQRGNFRGAELQLSDCKEASLIAPNRDKLPQVLGRNAADFHSDRM